jgi:hypothetical protein
MAQEAAARQFSFRLPESLIDRVEECRRGLMDAGLDVNRADVVRLLLKHALDATHCNHQALFGGRSSKKRARR